jgi:6-phosphogluconate dehydrogenase
MCAATVSANGGKIKHRSKTEITPLADPDHDQYGLSFPDFAEVWPRGSVIASWLLDQITAGLAKDLRLTGRSARCSDSSDGRWIIKAAIDDAAPTPVLTAALYQRFNSRGDAEFQKTNLSTLRYQFGGHFEKPIEQHPLIRLARIAR